MVTGIAPVTSTSSLFRIEGWRAFARHLCDKKVMDISRQPSPFLVTRPPVWGLRPSPLSNPGDGPVIKPVTYQYLEGDGLQFSIVTFLGDQAPCMGSTTVTFVQHMWQLAHDARHLRFQISDGLCFTAPSPGEYTEGTGLVVACHLRTWPLQAEICFLAVS